jgi:hypothetical protein
MSTKERDGHIFEQNFFIQPPTRVLTCVSSKKIELKGTFRDKRADIPLGIAWSILCR